MSHEIELIQAELLQLTEKDKLFWSDEENAMAAIVSGDFRVFCTNRLYSEFSVMRQPNSVKVMRFNSHELLEAVDAQSMRQRLKAQDDLAKAVSALVAAEG